MLFNSYYFIVLFLPIVLICYYSANRHGRHELSLVILSLASFVFYAFDNVYYLGVLAISIISNWFVATFLNEVKKSKFILWIGLLFDVGVIFYFKYYDFFVSNINLVTKADFGLRHIIMPMGISFYTFQQISYLVDTYRGETSDYNFVEYMTFVAFFPQLVAGPIVLHSEVIGQFRDKERWTVNNSRFSYGLYVFSLGLAKKVLIADQFGKAVGWAWAELYSRSSLELALTMLFYTFQLYFDFSGYCDMAIGIAKMFNIDLPNNFNSPYKACSINDFWKRWHMTLTRFLTRYVYIPLGGNRKGKVRTYINILIVFLISGLWHGANWTFILWGALHGILQVLNRLCTKIWDKIPKAITWFITFLLVNILWVMFYAPSVGDGIYVWKKIINIDSNTISPDLIKIFCNEELEMALGMAGTLGKLSVTYNWWYMAAYLTIAFVICVCCKNPHEQEFRPTALKAFYSSILALWSIVSLTGVSTFLYSNF